MRPRFLWCSLSLIAAVPLAAQDPPVAEAEAKAANAEKHDSNWSSFRGTNACGVAEGYALPLKWDTAKGEHVAWKTPIPGLAHSSPVVFGERIFLTTAVKDGEAELRVGLYGDIAPVKDDSPHELQVLCLERATGKILWTKTAWQGVPAIMRHTKGSHAASTPAADAEHVVAFFGSEGLYCYDNAGELLWKKEFGVLDSGFYMMPTAQWGFGSSPVIHEGRVYVQCDVQKDSFVAAFDVDDGKEIWRIKRDDVPTWSTPAVVSIGGRNQLVLNGYKHAGGYDLDTGKELWKLSGGGDIPVPTPVVAHDLIFLTSAHGRAAPILAVSPAAEGKLTIDPEESEHLAWGNRKGGNYMQTPLVYGDELYMCNDMGVLTCLDARTGKEHYHKRLDSGVGFTASGVAGDGKLYFTSEEGGVYVIKPGKEYEELGVNELGETCMATPAISQGTLLFRARHHLIAIK